MKKRYAAPVPEVHYIPSLFRKIQNGELRIPAFQRGYVWKENHILDLMESIFLGYPIGSLLFWKTETGQLREVQVEGTAFPSLEERSGDVLYVLDGMQRLSTLYAAFHKSEEKSPLFKVAYDFIEERFYHPIEEDALREGSLLLESIFNPRELLAFQSAALSKPDGDSIVAKSIELHSIFQEYLIPTVTINERAVPDVVEIFSRVNSTGVKLDVVDFMRALTWSAQFDLTEEVSKLKQQAEPFGFVVEGHTFVKLIALCAGFQTTADSMYDMSSVNPADLHHAVELATRLLPLIIDSVAYQNRILNSDLLGYEGQFLIWAAALKAANLNLSEDFSAIRKLVWQIGFGELLRGKPDHFLDKILQKILNDQWNGFVGEVRLSPETFMSRRFLNGRALSSAFVSMFYERVSQLREAEMISSNSNFDGQIFPAFRVDRRFGETRSDKIFVNLFTSISAGQIEAQVQSCSDLYENVHAQLGAIGLREWMLINFIDPENPPQEPTELFHARAKAFFEFANDLMGKSN